MANKGAIHIQRVDNGGYSVSIFGTGPGISTDKNLVFKDCSGLFQFLADELTVHPFECMDAIQGTLSAYSNKTYKNAYETYAPKDAGEDKESGPQMAVAPAKPLKKSAKKRK